MPTPQWRIEFACEFIKANKTLDDCFKHSQIQHQLKAAGFELKKYISGDSEVFSIFHDGEEHRLLTIQDLLQFLQ